MHDSMLGWHVTHGENSGLQSGMCRYLSLHAACVDSACQSIGNSANYVDSARFGGVCARLNAPEVEAEDAR